jgi:poly-gamma-glutamate synthesis protein (capsule biosynthesis protein)
VTFVGINKNDDKYRNIDIIEKNGIKIAILNYTYGTNGISMPKSMPHAVDTLEEKKVIEDLKYAEKNADFTIVCPHWGTEYNLGTDKSQKKWAKIFRENGADLILGTHPHVIEPVEFIQDDTAGITNNHGNGDMLVYYSLGNFVNWTSGKGSGVANRMIGGMSEVTIGRAVNGEVVIKGYGIKALVCHVTSGAKGVTVYPLSEYTEKLGRENEITKQDTAFSYNYCIDLCNKVWGNLWK